ncbi:MAG: tyrosine-type recombinase/integrase [Fidelibacterota bacterium]
MNSKKRTYKRRRHPGVRPKGPGKWIIDYCDYNGKRHQKVFKGREKDAVQFRNSLLVKVQRIKAGLEAPPKHKRVVTLEKLWNQFEEDYRLKVAAGSRQNGTLRRYGATIKSIRQVQPALLKKLVTKVTPNDLETFKLRRLQRGVAPATLNSDLRSLKALFNYALKRGYLDRSPMRDVSATNTIAGDVRYLNEEELESLRSCLASLDRNDPFQRDARDLVLMYLYTGCRANEILVSGGFLWEHVNEDTLVIHQTKQHRIRKIILSPTVRKVLEERRGTPKGPFHLTYDQAYKRVKYVLNKAGIHKASIQTLRKTAGAWYYIATRDIFATSNWLGHSNVLVTQYHYAGLIQTLKTEYSQAFEQTMSAKLSVSGCNKVAI